MRDRDPYYDEDLARWWTLFNFREALENLTLPADKQLKAFEEFVPPAVELVNAFDDYYARLEDWFEWWNLSQNQRASLDTISRELDDAPRDADSLATSPIWARLRLLAKEALSRLDWTLLDEPPPTSVVINGVRIAYKRAGSGPPLVLLHGFISDSRVWRPQLEDLSRDFDVIAWDCPGCGRSSDPPEEFTMAEFAGWLGGFLDQLGVASAHFLGLSWGGTLALEFNRQHPGRVRSLILSGAYAGWAGSLGAEAAEQRLARCLRESELPAEEWVPQWAPEAFSSGAPKELLDEYAEIMSDFHPVGFRAMSRAVTPDFRELLSLVNAPTLLIWGDGDTRSSLSVGQAMCDSIKGARMVVIPNAGHVSNMEQPERFNAEVRDFLQTLEGHAA